MMRITRKLLNEYQKLKREIPLLEDELKNMICTDAGIGNSVIMDYRKGYPQPQAVTGFDWKRYERQQDLLKRKKEKMTAVEEWIGNIEDVQARYVFRLYYIDGLSWKKIAQKIGYSSNPDYPRLCIRDPFLEKNGIK